MASQQTYQQLVERIGFIPARALPAADGVYLPVDLAVAKRVAAVIEEVCLAVYAGTGQMIFGDPGAPALDDEKVERVIEAIAHEYDAEGVSRTRGWRCVTEGHPTEQHAWRPVCEWSVSPLHGYGNVRRTWYDLHALPHTAKRALVERVWRIWEEWRAPREQDDAPRRLVVFVVPPAPVYREPPPDTVWVT